MELNEIKYGFKLIEVKYIEDINVTMYKYLHLKSGGLAVHLACDDNNKAFAIGFKTVPTDSTGVCHILEHSLLCGSKKYPLKEPFVNLLKTSLASFLNAFTSSDWTMFPFASPNDQDFDNILSVYLDAVFNPLVMHDNKAFLQEGWHLELFNKDDIPSYKGVVYNEMKGEMSNVNRILSEETNEEMFKDTTYHYNSGGDPLVIPTLTYEHYKEFYYKHYRPENALTVFYGDLDVMPRLKFLDEEYFSKFTKTGEKIEISKQAPFISTDKVVEYEIGEEEDEKNNAYISLCYALDDFSNYEEFLAMNILSDALLSNNDSPVTKTLLDAKLGEDISYYVEDSCITPSLYIALQKTNKNKKDEFINLFLDKIRDLVKNGIDKKLLLSKINHYEFIDKEQDSGTSPKGISFAISLMSSFNYDVPLETRFEFSKYYKKFKEELNNGYFEHLLEKYILNSKHYCAVTLVPSKSLAKRKKDAMDKKMRDIKANMSEEQINALIKMNNELLKYQSHVDTKKELSSLPTLKIKDLSKEVFDLNSKKVKVNGMSGISHTISTNHISYLKLYFNMNKLNEDELKYAYLLYELLLGVPTTNYSVPELSNLIDTYLGEFQIGESCSPINNKDYNFHFKVELSALDEFVNYIPLALNEVLLHSKFPKKIVLQTLKQALNNMKNYIIRNGHLVAKLEASSYHSVGYAIEAKAFKGIRLYEDLKAMLENFDYKEVNNKLKEVSKKLFNKKNVFYSISGDTNSLNLLRNALKDIKLPRKEYSDVLNVTLKEKKDVALIIPSDVNYNAISTNFEDLGYSYSGAYAVLNTIVNYDYLWNNVRVKGGAYGCSIGSNKSNDLFLASYRDPNVKYTYETYSHLDEFVKTYSASKKELLTYIIGTCAGFERPMSTPASIKVADINYINNYTKKMRLARKKEIINTKLSDINSLSDAIKASLEVSTKCSVGNKDKLNEINFDEVHSL